MTIAVVTETHAGIKRPDEVAICFACNFAFKPSPPPRINADEQMLLFPLRAIFSPGISTSRRLWLKFAMSSSAQRLHDRSLRLYARGATPRSSSSFPYPSSSICSARPVLGSRSLSRRQRSPAR